MNSRSVERGEARCQNRLGRARVCAGDGPTPPTPARSGAWVLHICYRPVYICTGFGPIATIPEPETGQLSMRSAESPRER